MADLTTSLRTHFGFTAFRPGQAEAVENLLAGQHTLVVMPTGAGKSLIYQLAALHRPGLTLVISPLIALMKDQVDSLARHNIPATCINSALPTNEQARRLQAMTEGAFRLAYVAPERLRSTPFQEALRSVTVSLLAVDEAHCISQWGHDFRPDYLHIASARSQMGDPVTVALTATATPQVQDDIVRLLGLPSARRIVTGFNRPNLSFEVRYTADLPAKLQTLQHLLAGWGDGAAIVYVGTRRDAEEVAEFVRNVCGLEAQHYHAGLDAETRTRVQEAFLAGDLPIVVATNAFGMGIDRPDVRLVVHYTLPGTLEAYYQEAGRAGRDGQPARAVLLYAPQDRALQEWFIENDAPTLEEIRALYEALRGSGRSKVWLTTDDLSLVTGLPEVKVKVGLAQLEAAGAVQRLGDAGLRMLLRPGPWDEAAVQATAAGMEERRHYRRAQLAQMIAYAEANSCRRRMLLDHFGDRGPAEAPRCCDNCLSRQAASSSTPVGDLSHLSQAERAALVILDALRRLKWEVGREKLARLLKGSRAREMHRFGYDQSVYYGRLAIFSLREIEDLIGQLIAQGYLKVIGGERPVLRLTPQGEAALKARASIPLRLPRGVSPEAIARKQAEREAGGTVALTAQMFAQGLTPAEIAAQRGLKESTIYGHLARLIGEGAVSLSAVVPEAIVAQVRAAIAQVGDVSALAPIKACLPDDISYGQIRCVVEAWRREQRSKGEEGQGDKGEDIATFLARPHPRPLTGPWHAGWALGFHSCFAGAEWSRSPVGELAYRLKYQNDLSALPPLVEQALALCAEHPELADVDAIVPVPPSTPRPSDPVSALADALGTRLGRPVRPVLVKTRNTKPQKEMHTLAQKRANVAGAFAVRGDVRGQRLLILDDLYDSGATLEEVCRVLRQAGAARLCVLTLTRTIHTDA
jgi:ATP-dependent DNA helicase RecQ